METLLATPGIFALLLGVVLLIVSVIGGELEIKEIKIPKLRRTSRIVILLSGIGLVTAGCLLSAGSIYLSYISQKAASAPAAVQTAPQKIEIQIDSSKIGQQLPTDVGIPTVVRDAIVSLIANADQAEINAVYYQDKSYLTAYYAGDALTLMNSEVDNAASSGNKVLNIYSQDKSYFAAFRQLDNITYSIDACEYWSTDYYDASGQLVTSDPEQLFPQTVTIEDQSGQFYLTAITTYSGTVFCTR